MEQEKVQHDVPDPANVMGTMKYWDDYRARERARFAAMNLKLDDQGVPLPGQGLKLDIGEFPTSESLAKKAAEDKRKAEIAAMPPVLASPKKKRVFHRVIDFLSGIFR